MADPSANLVPHLLGILLDTQGVAGTQVVARNRTTGDKLIKGTDSNKRVIFDSSNFTSGYALNDVIEFENAGASVGSTTLTITDIGGDFQTATLDAAAAPTVSIGL